MAEQREWRLGSLLNPHPLHYDVRGTVAYELALAGRALRAALAEDRFENGLREGSDLVLLELARLESADECATPGRLREALELSGGALTVMLRRAELLGYVRRVRDPRDRRRVRVELTETGRSLAISAGAIWRWGDEALRRELTASEIDVLRDLLGRARRAWRGEAAACDDAAIAVD